MSTERVVHATRADGCQIVRYDRAGKWYLEWPPFVGRKRERISLVRAVDEAAMAQGETGGHVAFGRYGGGAFNAMFRRLHAGSVDA